jgi:ArsR family transcriptional regulator
LSFVKYLDFIVSLAILPNMQTTSAKFQQQKSQLLARTRVIKALAHPTRLFIVEELEKGERCVCDLTAMIGVDISTVSKHLSVLRQAGIVEDDKRRNQVFYRLKVRCILNFFGCVESVLNSQRSDALR